MWTIGVGTNDNLFVMMTNKGTETDSNCHQLIGIIRKTMSFLKDELMNKQVTIDNLIDIIENFKVIENNTQEIKNQK